jgi:hypothetical protein
MSVAELVVVEPLKPVLSAVDCQTVPLDTRTLPAVPTLDSPVPPAATLTTPATAAIPVDCVVLSLKVIEGLDQLIMVVISIAPLLFWLCRPI